jgi:uncharacterized protein (UPF0261 family)
MTTVVLLGSLDTKGEEFGYARDCIRELGASTILIDTGTIGAPTVAPDVTASEVAEAGGASLADLRAAGDRVSMQTAMINGATAVVRKLHDSGSLDAVFALGGSNNTTVAAAVFRTLPLGVPKLILTTMAAGNVRRIVGASDLMLAASVVDISGLNHVSRVVIANAAAAVTGMARAKTPPAAGASRPVVACSMIGLTTRAVTAGRRRLEELGYEVVVFHMTGVGGAAMEDFIDAGSVVGVLDLTTSELADELLGGICSAGPGRLTSAARRGVAQVIAPGGLDMINFGPVETVPSLLAGRVTHVHNAEVTLVRTNAAECAELGRRLAERAQGGREDDAGASPEADRRLPTTSAAILLPSGGLSAIDTAGQSFHDPTASAALADAVRAHAVPGKVRIVDVEGNLDQPAVGVAAADLLHELIQARTARPISCRPTK